MPVITTREFAEPPRIAQEAVTMLTAFLGEDDGASPLSARGRRRKRIGQMLQAGARIDAALELIALHLPQWQLRRLAYDDGEWHCALSRTREMPDWLDRCAEARHTDLALAILHGLLEAQHLEPSPALRRAKRSEPSETNLLCCDNFL